MFNLLFHILSAVYLALLRTITPLIFVLLMGELIRIIFGFFNKKKLIDLFVKKYYSPYSLVRFLLALLVLNFLIVLKDPLYYSLPILYFARLKVILSIPIVTLIVCTLICYYNKDAKRFHFDIRYLIERLLNKPLTNFFTKYKPATLAWFFSRAVLLYLCLMTCAALYFWESVAELHYIEHCLNVVRPPKRIIDRGSVWWLIWWIMEF